jgi:predicted AlkP superfamily phosphohydrolase/phosphomutase
VEKSLDIPRHEINFALARYFQARGMNDIVERVLRNLLQGLLTFTPPALRRPVWRSMYHSVPETLAYRFAERLNWIHTKVFAKSNSGPLFINVAGTNSNGRVKESEYAALRDNLIRDLLSVKDPMTGEQVFSQVYRREELYHGPRVAQAPDVIADHYNSACDLIVDNDPGSFCFVNRLNRFGDHVRDGLFVFSGPDFVNDANSSHRASIMDLPATLLHLYGVPIPDDFDGHPLEEFLAPEFRQGNPIRQQAADIPADLTPPDHSDDELEDLTEHLRGLGYL